MAALFAVHEFGVLWQCNAIRAHNRAWSQAPRFGRQTQVMPNGGMATSELSAILCGSQEPTRGLVSGVSEDFTSLSYLALGAFIEIRHVNHLLTDPWDHRVVTFQPQETHPPLSADPRVMAFGPYPTQGWLNLLSVITGAVTESQRLQSLHGNQSQAAMQQFSKSIDFLNAAIRTCTQTIARLRRQLQDEQKKKKPNPVVIRLLNLQIQEQVLQQGKLEGHLNQLQKAANAFSGPPHIPIPYY